MRKALILAAGIVLAAGSAWSQSSSRDRDDADGRGWREYRSMERGDRGDRWRGYVMREDDEDGERSAGRGARFFLRSGDTQLRIACGERESSQACVDAALRLFDRVQSSQQSAPLRPSSPQ